MAFSGNILVIGTTNISKLVNYKVGYHKLWASDTGRNMKGVNKGTLVGIFTKLTVTIGRLSENDMSTLLELVNVANSNVTYFDPEVKTTNTENFYFGDIEVDVKKIDRYGQITITIIANNPRS